MPGPAAATGSAGGRAARCSSTGCSKATPVPVIWTTNAIGNVDPAILRRMSHAAADGLALARDRAGDAAPCRGEEGVAPGDGFDNAARGGPRGGGRAARGDAQRAAGGRDRRRLCARRARWCARGAGASCSTTAFDRSTSTSTHARRADRAAVRGDARDSEHADVSLLLTGPPGTGQDCAGAPPARARSTGR